MAGTAAGRRPVLCRRTTQRLVLSVLLVLGCLLPVAATPGRADTLAYQFGTSGLDGGGFQNVVAFSPFTDADDHRPLLIGGDISGVHRSLDGGGTWTPSNAGLADAHIASLVFSTTVPGKVYAATDSALYVSTDFGVTWTARPGAVDFDANGSYRLYPQEHPRATGTLLALDDSGTTPLLYAATATQGVKRSSDDGATWERVALAGDHLRAIALDAANPDVLYVGDGGNGLQVSTDARTGLTFTRVPGGPAIPEELTFVGGTLYVAGGTAGLFSYDGAWHALANGVPAGPAWQAITGYVDPVTGQNVLFAGCAQPVAGQHTLRSTDGGASWTAISTGPGVTSGTQEYGQPTDWWAASKRYLAFTGPNFVASMIAVDPDDHGSVVVAGRGGAYVGVQSSFGYSWAPAVRGLMATVGMIAVPDPHLPGRVYTGVMDWTFVTSNDNGRHVFGDAVPTGAAQTGDTIALDVGGPPGSPSTVYLAASKPGGNTGGGAIYSNPDPVGTPRNWTDEQLPVTNDVLALGIGHSASGSRIVLAAVSGKGLYRKDGGTWALTSGVAPFATGPFGTFAWVPGTPVVYAMDNRGIWRSDAAGAPGSWTKLTPATTGYTNVTSLALDPLHPGVLYASDASTGGVVRISGADTAAPVTSVILPLSSPGPIAVTPSGALLAQDRATGRLLEAADPATGLPAFADVGGAFFAANEVPIRSLAVGPDGFVYTASNYGAMSVSPPPGLPPPPVDTSPPSAPPGLTSPGQTTTSVSLSWDPATDDVAVTDYQVLRNGVVVGSTGGATGYLDTGLLAGTAYAYSVRARDAGGNIGAPSGPLTVTTATPPADVTPPTAPTGLAARILSPSQVRLTWRAATDDVGVTGYRISRDGTRLTTVTTTTWTDGSVPTGLHSYAVTAVDAAGNESAAATTSATTPSPAPRGLTGTYFDTATFTTQKLVRTDATVNFTWGTAAPAAGMGPDTFSVRWTGRLLPLADGLITFYLSSDEGAELWIDGVPVVIDWTAHLLREARGTVTLTANQAHDIRIDYYDRTGAASVRLAWSGPGFAKQTVAAAQLLAR